MKSEDLTERKWGVQLLGGVFGGAVEINIDVVIRVLFWGNALNDVGTVWKKRVSTTGK